MAKQRTGYVYEDKVWFAAVEYSDKGKKHILKQRASTEAHANELAQRLSRDLKEKLGKNIKVSQKVFSQSTGWIARLTFTDEIGKRRNVKRRSDTKTEAKEELKRLINKLDNQGEQAIDGDRLTFRELARIYEERKLVPAEYHGERKVRGLRSYRTPRAHLKLITEHFGLKRIRNITHSDIEQFKQERLKIPVKQQSKKPALQVKERTIATVNRELEVLRAALRFAVRQGWLFRSPFETGAPLISKADETRRERVLSHDEEIRLLAACTVHRAHLKPLLIAALDTAARRGELFHLIWSDIDFENRLINLRATTTKTQRSRTIGMTERLYVELMALYEKSPQDPTILVFGITDTVKRSFAGACRDAGITGFRFHDCRHTAITRMVQSGMAPHLIMKLSGHTQPITFSRYVNIDEQTARQAATSLDRFNQSMLADTGSEIVN